MRTAFLVLNHRPPAQLLRLLRTLRSGDRDAPLVVHHDRFRSNFNESALEPLGSAHLLTSDVPVKWGDFSIVDVYWQSLAWMLEHVEFDWVVVLSAQDYPIKPLRALEDMLSQSDADVFMHAEKIDDIAYGRGRWERRRRYLYQYRDRPAAPVPAHAGVLHRVGHLTQEFVFASLNILQPYVHFYKLPDGLPRCVGVRARSTPFERDVPVLVRAGQVDPFAPRGRSRSGHLAPAPRVRGVLPQDDAPRRVGDGHDRVQRTRVENRAARPTPHPLDTGQVGASRRVRSGRLTGASGLTVLFRPKVRHRAGHRRPRSAGPGDHARPVAA